MANALAATGVKLPAMQGKTRAFAAALAAISFGVLAFADCGGEAAPPPATPATTTTAAAEPPPADETPTIDVLSGNPTEIRLDGKSIGTTPIKAYKLSIGRHEVTFLFPGDSPTQLVEVGPGESKVVSLDPPPTAHDTAPPPRTGKKP